MALMINTNVASLNAQRNMMKTTNTLSRTFSRLASGLRINTARDDAAGLAISNRFTSQIRGLNQSIRNANDAISLSQVAEGALDETTNALQRMRELAVQAANDTYSTSDRQSLQEEIGQLISEIDRIASDTEFNDQQVLQSTTSWVFHVGSDKGQNITVTLDPSKASDLKVNALSITSQTNADNAIATLTTAINSVSSIRAGLGAVQNRFESVVNNLANVVENISAARSRIMDADIAAETSALTKNAILQQAGTAVLAQANQQPQLALQLLG